jgi:hypothetical protein
MNRRRIVVALWAIAAALAVGLVLGAGGLWGKKSTRSRAVVVYIKRVDALQQQMRLPLTKLLAAYRNFSTKGSDPGEQARLASAERTFRTLETRISAVPAPASTKKLRSLLVQVVRAEDGVAIELDQLARFMPGFHSAIGGVTQANAQLGRSLAASSTPKSHLVRGTTKQIAAAKAAYTAASNRAAAGQADALDVYDGALGRSLRSLRRLQSPLLMAPAYSAQIESLEATRRAGNALAAALRKPQRTDVPVLIRRFTEASRLAGSLGAQRAEIAAIEAYDKRVHVISELQTQVQREVQRLQREFG